MTDVQPPKQVLKLSDAYEKQLDTPELELAVTIYNINLGNNPELLEACQLLKEYAQYVEQVRRFAKDFPLSEAVEQAVDSCIENGILADFLKKNRAEAIEMSIFEYDEERHLKDEREFGYQRGHEAGHKAGLKEGIQTGESRVNTLFLKLIESGRKDEIEKAVTDKMYQEKLFKEFDL